MDSGDIVTWNLGTLPAGQSRSVVFAAPVDSGSYAPPNNTVILSSAEVSHSGGAGVNATASVLADASPALVLSLTGDRNPVRPGEMLTYTMSYGNPGAVSLSGVILRAVLPAGTTFVSANEGGVVSGSEVHWDLGSVSVGTGGQRVFSVTVNAGLTNGAVIAGHAEIGGGEGRADVVTIVQTNPVLALTMTASPDPVRPGELINYAMSVVNRGAADLSGVTLRQLMPAYMVSIYNSGGTWQSVSGGNSYLDSGDTVTWNLGTLPAGQSRSVVFAAPVDSGSYAPPNGTIVPCSAEVSCANIGGANSAVATRIGNTKPSLTDISNQFVNPGSTISFTATASDRDVPAVQTLSYSLPVGSSLGATINSTIGLFSWATSPAQTPGVYSFTIRVTDNGTPPLSDEKSFTITVPPFKLTSPTVTGGKFSFNWSTQAGRKYQAQYKTNLNDPVWLSLGPQIVGDGTPASVTNAIGSASRRFFRVVQVP